MAKKNKKHAIMSTNEWLRNLKRDIHFAVFGEEPDMIEIESPVKQETVEQQKAVETVKLTEPKKLETPTPAEPKKVESDTCIVGIILGQKTPVPVEKPAEEKPETIDVKPVEKLETAKPAKPEKQETAESGKPAEPEKAAEAETPAKQEKPVAPQMIVKEGQRKLSKSERKALKKKQKEEAKNKPSSPETSATATATDKVKEAVAEGIETGEINVVHTNPYIELIQSKVKSWDNQGNALDENGAVILDANGNVVKVDPKAGMILMAMPQQQSQQQTA